MVVSSLFNRSNIIHMTTSVSRRLHILCIMLKMIAFFMITPFASVICEGWQFTHPWKTLAWTIKEGMFQSANLG